MDSNYVLAWRCSIGVGCNEPKFLPYHEISPKYPVLLQQARRQQQQFNPSRHLLSSSCATVRINLLSPPPGDNIEIFFGGDWNLMSTTWQYRIVMRQQTSPLTRGIMLLGWGLMEALKCKFFLIKVIASSLPGVRTALEALLMSSWHSR